MLDASAFRRRAMTLHPPRRMFVPTAHAARRVGCGDWDGYKIFLAICAQKSRPDQSTGLHRNEHDDGLARRPAVDGTFASAPKYGRSGAFRVVSVAIGIPVQERLARVAEDGPRFVGQQFEL